MGVLDLLLHPEVLPWDNCRQAGGLVMTQVSKMVLDKGCGLRLWGPHLLTHLGVKPNADKNSRKAK